MEAPPQEATVDADATAVEQEPRRPVDPDFEPEIIVFACHYCAYAAADLAGSLRLQYPATIRIIKLPCTGKLEVIHLLHAIESGADGVYAAGCMEGECHFLKGNLWARKRVALVKGLLAEVGADPERIEMYNMSSADGPEFARVANEFTERIRLLGPNPLRRHGVSPHSLVRDAVKHIAIADEAADSAAPPDDTPPPVATSEKGPAE
ncbi:MAG: hydrogenase iron-sulfur subunit [Thermoleophilia bacterium]|nr:hydrogenase iron-sulfur subunit [Thermoleophilia bacterium]